MSTNEQAGDKLANAVLAALGKGAGKEKAIGILTNQEAVLKFNVSRWTLRRWRLAGKISSAKLSRSKSGKVLLDGDSIQRYLDSLFAESAVAAAERK